MTMRTLLGGLRKVFCLPIVSSVPKDLKEDPEVAAARNLLSPGYKRSPSSGNSLVAVHAKIAVLEAHVIHQRQVISELLKELHAYYGIRYKVMLETHESGPKV